MSSNELTPDEVRGDVTRMLQAVNDGDLQASERLLPLVV